MNLKKLSQSPDLDLLKELIELKISKYSSEVVKMQSEFDTVWNMASKNGGIEALKSLIQDIENAR
jgi:uncharacterized protein (DUF111 family)